MECLDQTLSSANHAVAVTAHSTFFASIGCVRRAILRIAAIGVDKDATVKQ